MKLVCERCGEHVFAFRGSDARGRLKTHQLYCQGRAGTVAPK